MPYRVILIDDDERLFELLEDYLSDNDVLITHACDGPTGLAALEQGAFDAAFVDIMMPGMDGLEVLRRIRQKSAIPVVMLTAKGDDTDRIVGLELGADDYVPKPFNPRELLARLRAVLRRSSTMVVAERIEVQDLTIDVGARVVRQGDDEVDLTGIEFDILAALARRAGRVVPRDALLEAAGRGDVVVSDRTVDVHISHLRQKLHEDPRAPRLIKTVRGVGYVLSREES